MAVLRATESGRAQHAGVQAVQGLADYRHGCSSMCALMGDALDANKAATAVKQGPSRVSRVDGCVCLDDVLNGPPADRLDLAPNAAHHAWNSIRAEVACDAR